MFFLFQGVCVNLSPSWALAWRTQGWFRTACCINGGNYSNDVKRIQRFRSPAQPFGFIKAISKSTSIGKNFIHFVFEFDCEFLRLFVKYVYCKCLPFDDSPHPSSSLVPSKVLYIHKLPIHRPSGRYVMITVPGSWNHEQSWPSYHAKEMKIKTFWAWCHLHDLMSSTSLQGYTNRRTAFWISRYLFTKKCAFILISDILLDRLQRFVRFRIRIFKFDSHNFKCIVDRSQTVLQLQL